MTKPESSSVRDASVGLPKDRSQDHWVFVVGWLALGGAERQALRFAATLKERFNCRVTFIGLSMPGVVQEECQNLGFECYLWPTTLEGGSRRDILSKILRFAAHLRRLRPTYLAPYTMLPNLLCGITWRLTGASACVWQQRDEGRLGRLGRLERLALRLTPAFISNSEHARNWLVEALGVSVEKTRMIRNGIVLPPSSLSHEGSWRSEHGIAKDAPMTVMVANIHSYKDHLTLVRAWKKVIERSQGGPQPVLVLAGRHGDAYEAVWEFIDQEGLSESVLCPGLVVDVPRLLSDADLLAFSSLTEGCPNGVLEGMAVGLPVVGTDIPAIREAVGPNGVEFLAPPSDADALAERILAFIADPALAKRVGATNRDRIAAEFSSDRMADETLAVFERVSK